MKFNRTTAYFSLFILLVFSLVNSTKAQQTQGVVRYLVTGNWVKIIASADYLSKERKDRISYMWGNDAEWKSYCNLYFKDQKTKYEDSEEKADKNQEDGFAWRKEEYYIYRDFENHKIHDIIKFLGKLYVVEDSLVPQPWKILNDVKEVAGHICMNATWTDTVKDQKIIAWFALDLPVSAGPDRFCGLPGMILEVNINDGAMILSADKIDNTCPPEALELPRKIKGKHITDADYRKLIEKFINDKKALEEFWWGIRY